jgi:hypothetical protein
MAVFIARPLGVLARTFAVNRVLESIHPARAPFGIGRSGTANASFEAIMCVPPPRHCRA